MIRRLARFALDCYVVYLVSDLVLELGGRASPAADRPEPFLAGNPRAQTVEILDGDGHLLATFTRD